jgi:hypothetical protein
MDERERRLGENEALYRAVNEKITEINEAFGELTDTLTVICECGDLKCSQQVELAIADYERVRAEPTQFVVVPGHEVEDVETVVEENDAFAVVRKRDGAPAQLARETDPRS